MRRPKLLENVADISSDGETAIVFDWLEESNDPVFGYAEAAADALVARLIDGAQQGKWSLQRLHFIGHSRGTVVASEAIQRLGWYSQINGKIGNHSVDQGIHLTTLDPHPWDKVLWDQIGDPGSADDHDVNDFTVANVIFRGSTRNKLGAVCWENVAYCDNYYQNDGSDDNDERADWENLNGMPDVPGTGLNTELTNRRNMNHENVHTWYHGTILNSVETDDYFVNTSGDPNCNGCGSEIDLDWYSTDVLERDNVGYNYSLRGGGQAAVELIRSRDDRPSIMQDESIMNRLNIFNGDFEFDDLNDTPGWAFQGGEEGGHVQGSGFYVIGSKVLELKKSNPTRIHNWFYIPPDKDQIWFQKRLLSSSGDDILKVDLIRQGEEREVVGLPLLNGFQWEWNSFQVPTDFRGKAAKIRFRVEDFGLLPNATVQIDDVGFDKRIYSETLMIASTQGTLSKQTEVALPAWLHAYDMLGNHTGLITDSTWVTEIPESRFVLEMDSLGTVYQRIVLPPHREGIIYTYTVESRNAADSLALSITNVTEARSARSLVFSDLHLEPGAVASAAVETLSPAITLVVDEDGDGTHDDTVAADYRETFHITAVHDNNGSLSVDSLTYVNYGDTLTVEVVPEEGYTVDEVFVDETSVGAVSSYSFYSVQADHTIRATFVLNTGIDYEIVDSYALMQNYPNPFNTSTLLAFTLPEAQRVTLKIYDALGRGVRVLVDELKPAGYHTVTIDGKGMPNGLYFYTLQAGNFRKTRSMTLLK